MRDLPRVLHIALTEPTRAQQFVAELGEALCHRAGPGRAGVLTDSNRALLRRATRNDACILQVQRTGNGRADRESASRSLAAIRDLKPELIHAHGLSGAPLAGHLSRRLRVPWIVTAFGSIPTGWRLHRLLRRAARMVVLSHRLRPERPPTSIEVVPGGIDRREFSPAAIAENLIVELGLDPDMLHLGMAGRFDSPASGAFDFLEAVTRVIKRIRLAEFVVIGEGALLDSMQGYAHRARALGNIRFLGPRADRGRLYGVMDCVVLPAHECDFAWELLEAGAAGTPILVSDIPAHREVMAGTDPMVTFYEPGDIDAIVRYLLETLESPGRRLGPQLVDLSALGTGLTGTVLAEISNTHYSIGEDELEQVVDPDGPVSLRRLVYGIHELNRIARRYEQLYHEVLS